MDRVWKVAKWYRIWYHDEGTMMAQIERAIAAMKNSRSNVKFSDGLKVCLHYFGEYRVSGSHYIFKTSWPGDPWINIQNDRGKMKPYQVRQVIKAIDRLEGEKDA